MTIFPNEIIVSTPPGFIEEQKGKVVLRLFGVEEGAEALAARFGKRVRHIDMDARTLGALDSLSLLADYRVRLVVEDGDFPLVHEVVRNTVNHRLVLLIRPDPSALRRVNLLGEFNIPMHLDMSAQSAETDVLAALLNHYLHSPTLNAHIAPFNALMKHAMRGKGFSLWDTEYEKPGRYLYISDRGEVTLSKRFSEAGIHFGTTSSEWEEIAASEAYNRLLRYKDELFKGGEECVYCESFGFCEGYLKAVDPSVSCEGWQAVFNRIRRTVKEVGALIEESYGK
jgi:hypothetical protein